MDTNVSVGTLQHELHVVNIRLVNRNVSSRGRQDLPAYHGVRASVQFRLPRMIRQNYDVHVYIVSTRIIPGRDVIEEDHVRTRFTDDHLVVDSRLLIVDQRYSPIDVQSI